MAKKRVIVQKHHVCYEPEVIRNVRKGVHQICGLIRRYNHLEEEEVNCLMIEILMKRKF